MMRLHVRYNAVLLLIKQNATNEKFILKNKDKATHSKLKYLPFYLRINYFAVGIHEFDRLKINSKFQRELHSSLQLLFDSGIGKYVYFQ